MSAGVKVSKLNFELNPRGNLWFNDESTFGHKLLSKMGWSKGKGLGKNEDGIKENIKIAKKETNTGVGWNHDEIPVAVGCLEYENILQNLQKHFNNREKSPGKEKFEKSLEQRSRNARNHLHYQKFVRGKDLIRYSEKDMKSIFLEKPKKPVSDHPSRPPQETPTFNSQLSVNDYFALKMQKKRDEAAKLEANVTTENNVSLWSQPINKKSFKKQKFVSERSEAKADVAIENDISSQSQPNSEGFSKKRKIVSETPETKANATTETDISSQFQSINEKSSRKRKFVSESPETKANVATENNISSQSQHINEKPSKKRKFVSESPENETLKAKLKKRNHETSNSLVLEEDSVIDKSSESDERSKIKEKKKKKKSKRNKSRLQQLKSCLKSHDNYDLEKSRNVSFNEQVSYKILDTSLELCEEINDLVDEEQEMEEAVWIDEQCSTVRSFNEEPKTSNVENSDCVATREENGITNKKDGSTNEEDAIEEEGESGTEKQGTPPCFDLPKCSGSNFNFWLESQRQASKMKLYKEMAKKIRKDKILRSTNLLDIKGYGNWSL